MNPPGRTRVAWAAGCLVVVLAVALVGATVAPAAPVRGIAVVRLGRSASTGTQGLLRYSYVILSPSAERHARTVRTKRPRVRVLAYRAAMELAVDCATPSRCRSPITYSQARSHDRAHPGDPWLLTSASGAAIRNPRYPTDYLANVGSASYQRQWVSQVVSSRRRSAFNGIYVDNVLAQVSGWSGGVYPARYPSDRAWENAMLGFARYVGPALREHGFYVLTNTFKGGSNDGSTDIAWWRKIAPYVSGMMAEYFEQAGSNLQLFDTNPCCWTGHWLSWLRLASAAQSAGTDFFAGAKGKATDTHVMQYGKASFLLVWNGKGGGFVWQPLDGSDPWNPNWTTRIGAPTNGRYQVGVGWRRDFTAGTALVNPDAFSAQTFNLGGSYITPSGSTVSSVTLKPVTAMVLSKGRRGQQSHASSRAQAPERAVTGALSSDPGRRTGSSELDPRQTVEPILAPARRLQFDRLVGLRSLRRPIFRFGD
jgi:Hypothetical glycosyl hydrolase family 15